MATVSSCSISDTAKEQVWRAYQAGSPMRVPVLLETNPRVVVMDPAWNPDGVTFQQFTEDPHTNVMASLRHQLYRRTVLHQYSDGPTEIPEVWDADYWVYNVYEAAMLGAPLDYLPQQVPDTKPWLNDDNKHDVFKIDIEHPLDMPFIKNGLAFWHEMEKICKGLTFEGRPVRLLPWGAMACADGLVTVAMNLRGSYFMEDLIDDVQYADKLVRFILEAAIRRREAVSAYWGDRIKSINSFADDSIAMISTQMYRQHVLRLHRQWYDTGPAGQRKIHLCGDATHHFPLIREELGVTSFDTGFPVDHGALRQTLGDDVEILGGPPVALLLDGTPEEVYENAKRILTSGVKRGGRFVLREANNLPPKVPEENLAAMYQASLDFGQYKCA